MKVDFHSAAYTKIINNELINCCCYSWLVPSFDRWACNWVNSRKADHFLWSVRVLQSLELLLRCFPTAAEFRRKFGVFWPDLLRSNWQNGEKPTGMALSFLFLPGTWFSFRTKWKPNFVSLIFLILFQRLIEGKKSLSKLASLVVMRLITRRIWRSFEWGWLEEWKGGL